MSNETFVPPRELVFNAYPFITGVHADPAYFTGEPEKLPFCLTYDGGQGMIVQKFNPEVYDHVMKAYSRGSVISTPVGAGGINTPLAEEIVSKLNGAAQGIAGKTFFEVGCGSGSLLKILRSKGAKEVAGCEPGDPGAWGQEKEIKIYHEFIQDLPIKDQFDVVFSHAVMEHMSDPHQFIAQNIGLVKPGGLFFVSVPGHRIDLELGNFMVLAHEHYNYFTEHSLRRALARHRLDNIQISMYQYSNGIIAAWGRKPLSETPAAGGDGGQGDEKEVALLNHFVGRVEKILTLMQQRIGQCAAQGKSIGLYGAPRSLFGVLDFTGVKTRHFDGDAFKHGKYFTGSRTPIENPEQLRQDPVDELWVLPVHHDRPIRSYITGTLKLSPGTAIVSLLDLMNAIKEK